EAPAAVLPATLPVAGVPREDRQAAARIHEALDLLPLRPAPVLAVPDDQREAISGQGIRLLEVRVDEIVERIARLLRPGDEGMLPLVQESCRAVPALSAGHHLVEHLTRYGRLAEAAPRRGDDAMRVRPRSHDASAERSHRAESRRHDLGRR